MHCHLDDQLVQNTVDRRRCRLAHTGYANCGSGAYQSFWPGQLRHIKRSLRYQQTCQTNAIAGQRPSVTPVKPLHTGPNARTSQPGSKEAWPCTQQVLDDVVSMFNTMPYEFEYWVDKAWVTGTIPKELSGTYLRNGPALQSSSGNQKRHFMDADGCVFSLAFPGGGAMPRFTNKYVRTKGFLDEQVAGKPVHRNAFTRGSPDGSVLFNPFNLNFKNVANTGVLYWADRLWALWEVGRPYELCPHTLNTVGESDMDGQVGARIAGHYKTITEVDGSQRLLLFGAEVSFTGMHLAFYEMNEDGKVIAESRHQLQGISLDVMFVHDMVVTEHWYCVVMGPVQLDVKGFFTDYLIGKKSLGELLVYNKDKPSKIFLFPRPGKTPPTAAGTATHHVLEAPPFFTFHHVNAYERKGGAELVMDTISWQDIAFDVTQHTITADYYRDGCRSQLYRLIADLPSSSIISCQKQVRRTLEYPTFATSKTGKPYRHAYFSGDAVDDERDWSPAQAVVKVTLPEDREVSNNQPQNHNGHIALGMQQNNIIPWNSKIHSYAETGASLLVKETRPITSEGSYMSASDSIHQPMPTQSSIAHDASSTECQAEDVICEEWRPGQRKFPGEPMFVPRPGATAEDDGWIIVGVHDGETQRGEVAILDAQRISDGPVAVIHLPHQLPMGLHGTWTDVYLGPDPGDPRVPVWCTPNKIREV